MYSDNLRFVLAVALGVVIGNKLYEELRSMRDRADEWEAGIQRKSYQEGYRDGIEEEKRTAQWNREHPGEELPMMDPAEAIA